MGTPALNPPGYTKVNWYDPKNITDCWIDYTTSPNIAKYHSDTTKSPYLDNAIITACAAINRMCNRKFNIQQFDEIFTNETLAFRDFKIYVLKNRPLITVDNVWLNITNTFSAIDLTYLQVLTDEGIVKILPTFSVYVQTTLPFYAYSTASNLWIRYTSGYAIADVPFDVKLATAMWVDYYFSRFNLVGGVTQFSTQTYSQTNVTGKGMDSILVSIDEMLTPYKIYSIK